MRKQLIGCLIFILASSWLSARPAPSYVKHERFRLNTDGYTMILFEHIPEYRHSYQTVRIVDDANEIVALFTRCNLEINDEGGANEENILCFKDSSSAKINIRYDLPKKVQASWDDGQVRRIFTNGV